jgi:hypothetical protein
MKVAGILCSPAKPYVYVKHESIHIKIKFLWNLSGFMVSSVYLKKCKNPINLTLCFDKTNLVQ